MTEKYKNKIFTIYGKPQCHFCTKAKDLLIRKSIPYVYYEIGKDLTVAELFHIIDSEVRSVPQIMVDNHLIGDYNSLVRYLKNDN